MPDGYDFVFPQDSINSFGSFFDLMLGSNQRIDFNIENQKCDNHKEETFVFTTDDLDKVDFSPSSLKYIAYVDSPSYMNFIRFKFKFSVEKVEAEDSFGRSRIGKIEWIAENSVDKWEVNYLPNSQLLGIPNLYSKGNFIPDDYYYMPIYYSGVFINN